MLLLTAWGISGPHFRPDEPSGSSVVFLNPSKQKPRQYIKLRHETSLPNNPDVTSHGPCNVFT